MSLDAMAKATLQQQLMNLGQEIYNKVYGTNFPTYERFKVAYDVETSLHISHKEFLTFESARNYAESISPSRSPIILKIVLQVGESNVK
jgi:hypothetical protein